MNIAVAPCKNCKEHSIHCHSICKKYKDYKKARELINKKRQMDKILDDYKGERR